MSRYAVLVVDDEPAGVRAVARALADDCRVVTATGGGAALQALQGEGIALMIVDQRMPDMLGTELLARTARTHPDIIRVVLTGYTDVETLMEAINAGHVYAYLTKPWEARELRLVVRRGLERYAVEADRQRLLRAWQQACARLRRAADRKGRLLAVAAHELATPVHLLANALDFIAALDPPPAIRSWLDGALRCVDWLGRSVAQLHTAGGWPARRLALRLRPLDLQPVLRHLQRRFAAVLGTRRLALRFEVPGPLPLVAADAVWLGRALSNLLSNAVRCTPDGGCITVTAACPGGGVEITVRDTGIGIDPQLIEELFEPFSAACGDPCLHTSGRFEFGARGLGLGLSIAKMIVDQHGGRIGVRSVPGSGSQFTVILPAAAAPLAAPGPSGADGAPPDSGRDAEYRRT
jgi:two-component system sensor histidine kinase/response regulator